MKAHRELIRELEQRGYMVRTGGNGHYRVLRPNGSYVMTMSHSPRDSRAEAMARRLARRLGLLEG